MDEELLRHLHVQRTYAFAFALLPFPLEGKQSFKVRLFAKGSFLQSPERLPLLLHSNDREDVYMLKHIHIPR